MDLESGVVVIVGNGKGAEAWEPFGKRLRPSRARAARGMALPSRSTVPVVAS